jgi:L-serine dehydratase
MAPRLAAEQFLRRGNSAANFRVTLYGSLALTGRGHLTHEAIIAALSPRRVEIIDEADQELLLHPNGMIFEALDERSAVLDRWCVYSVGGGELIDDKNPATDTPYKVQCMEQILKWCDDSGNPIWMLIQECEESDIWAYLDKMWNAMSEAISRGLNSEGALPGELCLCRRAHSVFSQVARLNKLFLRTGLLSSYALAVAEENASGSRVVTAPTCGSSGVLPAVLKYFQDRSKFKRKEILRALATAGLIGNLIKTNASISGAEVGCQGEIGAACAMAAAAVAQMLGGSPHQIEYAAEMGLEHHLGLTCDPVAGLVQIPCIERNAMAAVRAVHCAEYALLSDGRHRISFDQVVETMKRTGHDLPNLYRETACGGLALTYKYHSRLES